MCWLCICSIVVNSTRPLRGSKINVPGSQDQSIVGNIKLAVPSSFSPTVLL